MFPPNIVHPKGLIKLMIAFIPHKTFEKRFSKYIETFVVFIVWQSSSSLGFVGALMFFSHPLLNSELAKNQQKKKT